MLSRRSALLGAGIAALSVAVPAAADDATTANKTLAQRYIDDVWGKGNANALDPLVSPDFVSSNADDAPGPDAFKARVAVAIRNNASSVQNIVYAVTEMTAEADRVVIRGSITGASRQGKKIDALFFDELRFASGLIVSEWSVVDTNALLGF